MLRNSRKNSGTFDFRFIGTVALHPLKYIRYLHTCFALLVVCLVLIQSEFLIHGLYYSTFSRRHEVVTFDIQGY